MNIYQTFVTVVKLGGFSAAAKKLHRSPSSISKKMAQLEERLNVQLFDRTTRNLEITEAGKLYYDHCLEISRRIEDAENALTGLSSAPAGNIKITWPNAISTSGVVEVLDKFCKAYPDIKLNIDVANDHVNLIDDKIDLAFRLDPNSDSSMIAIELFRLDLVTCATPEYLECFGAPSNLEELLNRPLLLLNHSRVIQKFWRNLPGMKGLDLDEHHLINDINGLYNMTVKGLGATILFRHMVERDIAEGRLVELIPEHTFPQSPVYLMFHKNNFMPEKIKVFIDFFKDYYLGGATNTLASIESKDLNKN